MVALTGVATGLLGALVLELTHSGFGLMVPMIAATVTATAIAYYINGYSIYSARLPARPPDAKPHDPRPGADGDSQERRSR